MTRPLPTAHHASISDYEISRKSTKVTAGPVGLPLAWWVALPGCRENRRRDETGTQLCFSPVQAGGGASRTPKRQTSPICKLSAAKGFIFSFSSRRETWRADGAAHLAASLERGAGGRAGNKRARRRTVAPGATRVSAGRGRGWGRVISAHTLNRPLTQPLVLRYQRSLSRRRKHPRPGRPRLGPQRSSFGEEGDRCSRGTRCGLWPQGGRAKSSGAS